MEQPKQLPESNSTVERSTIIDDDNNDDPALPPQLLKEIEASSSHLHPSIPIVKGHSILHSFLIYRRMADSRINHVVRLAEWVLQNNFCTFNGTTYLQIQGTAMGTPFEVVYACVFLSSTEMEVLAKITNRHNRIKGKINDWLSSRILPSQWN